MPLPIPSLLIEFILFGPLGDRRLLQDSPILGDVWIKFGKEPGKAVDLLIVPCATLNAGAVANVLCDAVYTEPSDTEDRAHLACLQGFVAATLSFEQMMKILVPKTKWWVDQRFTEDKEARMTEKVHPFRGRRNDELLNLFGEIFETAKKWRFEPDNPSLQSLKPGDRLAALTGLLLWAGKAGGEERPVAEQTRYVLERAENEIKKICETYEQTRAEMFEQQKEDPLIWQIALNRPAMPAMTRSIPSVKADAAKSLFKVNCKDITWAVIDSGIDAEHPAFWTPDDKPECRVKRSFDFRNFMKIVSLGNLKDNIRRENAKVLLDDENNLLEKPANAEKDLRMLAEGARNRNPIRWDIIEKFVEIDKRTRPVTSHGTHVAGIIGANKEATRQKMDRNSDDFADGMCPEIRLYDFRVLGTDLRQTEFAIIAALQYIRHLNDADNFYTIHGANLSLSIPHDVRNFACGSTPICNECTRLSDSGVVVVAAAGNHGHKSFQTSDGAYDLYTAFSITDPGNADAVITVGSTHGFWPHTYGVSYFSSRGPTGDGRIKPDLLAPGERIRAPLRDNAWGDLDGTSMAAPHVSGAAAMLMARYPEFIGKSRRIKEILCKNATDLGRERTFQGHGMLDVLRAFQSI